MADLSVALESDTGCVPADKEETADAPSLPPRKKRRDDSGQAKHPTFKYCKPSKTAIESVEAFLARRFLYHSLDEWKKLVEDGRVYVNGTVASAGDILRTKDEVSYRKAEQEPPVDSTFQVHFLDDHLIVVSKSGNIPVNEGGMYYAHTLLHVVRRHLGTLQATPPALYTAHRLDRETSGLVAFGRTPQASQALGAAFTSKAVRKVYYGVLVGHMSSTTECDEPIVEQWHVAPPTDADIPHVYRLRMACSPEGKEAQTVFEPLAHTAGATLCRIRPQTGRTHQIRVHAHHLGFPLLGDKLYGQSDSRFLALSRGEVPPEFPPFGVVPRHQLHAGDLTFPHPTTGQTVTYHSDPAVGLADCPFVAQHFADAFREARQHRSSPSVPTECC
jgi:23S rRNA pseudouridine1911/1915/1917 synthase